MKDDRGELDLDKKIEQSKIQMRFFDEQLQIAANRIKDLEEISTYKHRGSGTTLHRFAFNNMVNATQFAQIIEKSCQIKNSKKTGHKKVDKFTNRNTFNTIYYITLNNDEVAEVLQHIVNNRMQMRVNSSPSQKCHFL